MNDERRRFFRINETVGISWQLLDGREGPIQSDPTDILSLVSEQDQRIEHLLIELEDSHPKVSELISLFNQKLERVVGQMIMDNSLVNRMAHRAKEANISACGIAFIHDDSIAEGANLRIELTLFPTQRRVVTDGRVVACNKSDDGKHFYWRIDFYAMSKTDQETLIQHIGRSQSQQLSTFSKFQPSA